MTSWVLLLAVISFIVLVGAGVAVLVVLLVRRSDRATGHPAARDAPGATGSVQDAPDGPADGRPPRV